MNMIFKKSAIVAAGLLLCQVVGAANEEKYSISLESTEVVTYDQNPENLQNNSGEVPVAFTISIPQRAIKASNARVYKPVLVNGAWRYDLPSIIVKGRTYDIVKGEEYRFGEDNVDNTKYYASYVKPAGSGLEVLYETSASFHPSMRGAQLEVNCEELTITRGKGFFNGSSSYVEVNNGVKDYTNLYDYDQTTYLYNNEEMVDNFGTASIFEVGSTVLDRAALDVPLSNLAEHLKSLKCAGAQIDAVDVKVAASFEGSLELNSRLARGRERSIKEVVDATFPCMLDIINYSHEDENWDGFIEAVSREPYAELALSIIDGESDLDRREQKLLATQYRADILDICANLRNCSVQISYKAPKSIEKVGQFEPNMVQKGASSNSNVNVPADIYEQNTLMLDYMNAGDYAKAFAVYEKMETTAPAISNNIGVLLTLLGDYPMAEYYFSLAEGMESRDYNLGTMYLRAGKFAAAADTFAEMSCPNAVIANLAAGRYDMAAKLACGGEYTSAKMLYLRAVAYTYVESDDMVLFTLDKACELDPLYKEYAENYQAEFIPFRVLPAFKKIVK